MNTITDGLVQVGYTSYPHFVDFVENEKKAKNMRLAVAIFMRVTPNDQNGYVGPCQPNL